MDETSRKEALDVASAHWGIPNDQLAVQEFNSSFPWVKRHALLYVSDFADHGMLLARGATQAVEFASEGWQRRLNDFFVNEDIDPSRHLSPDQLALTVRALCKSPLGALGTPTLLEEERSRLEKWSRDPTLRDRFAEFCDPPRVTREGEDWSLVFTFFNRQGGVERWAVAGKGRELISVSNENAVADGTYRFAYV